MLRRESLEAVLSLAGPLGPLESYDERYARKQRWLREAGNDAFDSLLDLVTDPPLEDELAHVDRDDFEFELSDLLIGTGSRDPVGSLAKIAPLLTRPQQRPLLIDVIGGLRAPEGVDWLRQLVLGDGLSDDELVRIASALGEISGDRARAVLDGMRQRFRDSPPEVAQEIEIALRAAGSPGPAAS